MLGVKHGLGGRVEVPLPFWFEDQRQEPALHLSPSSLVEGEEFRGEGSRTRRADSSCCACPAGREI